MSIVTPVNKEYVFEGSVLINQTDLEGNLTFTNRKFCEVSGYKADELDGINIDIIRHQDMPKALFAKMWSTIQGGQAWNGLIKNLRHDGLFYWTDTEILPVIDDEETITGYISVSKVASQKDVEENKELYKKMLDTED